MFKDIPKQALIHYSVEIYSMFSNKLSKDKFIKLFQSLPEEDVNNFFRACSSYIQSQKCLTCDPENTSSLALSILCTSIETISQNSKKVPYHVWLWKQKLDILKNQPKLELENILKDCYQEYLRNPLRTGARYDFTRFLIEHGHSEETEISPIKLYKKGEKVSRPISFEDSVNRIYEKYRSRFMHDSIKRIDVPDRYRNTAGVGLLEPEKKGTFNTDVIKLPIWFSNVVRASLYNYLVREHGII